MSRIQNHLWLSGGAYRLGEIPENISAMHGIEQAFMQAGLKFLPDVFGLGTYYRTNDIYTLISNSVKNTLQLTGVDSSDVSEVVLSSASFKHNFDLLNKGLSRILLENGIDSCKLRCVTGMGCVSLINAIDLASASLINASSIKNILFINVDFLAPQQEIDRFIKYAVVGDSACSFILSNVERSKSLRLGSIEVRSIATKMGVGIRAGDYADAKQIARCVCRDNGVDFIDIKKFFSNNIFLPFKTIKERALGFSKEQLYLENVKTKSHNYGSDTVINLCNYLETFDEKECFYVLMSEADGHYGAMLLKS